MTQRIPENFSAASGYSSSSGSLLALANSPCVLAAGRHIPSAR
jgi:hypothetical protein